MQKLALLSLSEGSGLVDCAKQLVQNQGYTLFSTGDTAKALVEAALPAIEVSEHTWLPEIMNGRLKTLNTKIHGEILCSRDIPEHKQQAQENNVPLIDLVVVKLYPFHETISRENCTLAEAIENIDIGGPTMLRSAHKNNNNATVVCDPLDYKRLVSSLKNCSVDTLKKEKALRYGEIPHQQATLYGIFFHYDEQLQGKELSYNNILDISAATYLIGEFEQPTAASVKHTNSCSLGSGETREKARALALARDKKAPFLGIIALNRTLYTELEKNIKELFSEVIIAPEFTSEALEIFLKKTNLRLMLAKPILGFENLQEIRSVVGGMLAQDRDFRKPDPSQFKIVTERQATKEEWGSLLFGWRVVKNVKSHTIVYAREEHTLCIGADQISQVDSSEVAIKKSKDSGLSLESPIIASAAFFLLLMSSLLLLKQEAKWSHSAHRFSKGDSDVIKAANENNIAIIFADVRHFKY